MKKAAAVFCCMFLGILVCACGISWADTPVLKETFPRLMGMNIGAKNYHDQRYQDEISRLDIVILGFYPGWSSQSGVSVRDAVQAIKKRNPHILIGQYTILDEAYDNLDRNLADKDKYFKLNREGWWLRNAAGRKVQWTDQFNSWMVNITEWTKPDSQGQRYPQWVAQREYRMFFEPVPEFDIWFLDGVNYRPRVIADWNLDGRDDDKNDPVITEAYRKGHKTYWGAIRSFAPVRLLIGNADNDLSYPEFIQSLDGAFLESLMGLKWSIETWGGWHKAMERYWAATKNTRLPHIVGFSVHGKLRDYRFMRYALASCLMGDGYFSYTDVDIGYSSVPWFDEYDVRLGRALEPPQKTTWRHDVYRRIFENGMVLVNPTDHPVRLNIGPGYRRIVGTQDPEVNNGKPAHEIVLPSKGGLVLVRDIAALSR